MNSKEYWVKRKSILDKKAVVAENTVLREIQKEYSKTLKSVQSKISLFYAKYGKDNIIEYTDLVRRLPTSELKLLYEDFDSLIQKHPEYAKLFPVRKKAYALNRLEGLQVDVLKSMSELGIKEEQAVKKFMEQQYQMGYLQTIDDLEGVMKVSRQFNGVNQRSLNFALKNKWIDGKNYSGRIWEQKAVLSNYLFTEFKTGVAQGKSIHELSDIVQNRFNKSKYTADRLVRTESNYILNESEFNAYEDEGIKEYEYLATLDGRTSNICEGLHGRRFKVKDRRVGENAPPAHPFCRSTTVPVIDEVNFPYNKTIKETDREELANKLLSDSGLNISTNIANIDANGSVRFEIVNKEFKDKNGNVKSKSFMKTKEYNLKKGDVRNIDYQIKTVFHEYYHSQFNDLETDILKAGKEEWLKIEDTFAECAGHYLLKNYGGKNKITPSYANYMVDILPKLKHVDEFSNCSFLSDFGKIAYKYRFIDKNAKWEKIIKKVDKVDHDVIEYYKGYKPYIKSNKDKLVNMILDSFSQPVDKKVYKQAILSDLNNILENDSYNNRNEETVFNIILSNAMNNEGVK